MPNAPEAVSLPVVGMTCAACAANIERALKKLPGIGDAGVNYATNRATGTFDPSVLDVPAIVEAIRDVGYDVGVRPGGHMAGGIWPAATPHAGSCSPAASTAGWPKAMTPAGTALLALAA